MKKLLTKIAGVSVGIAMAVGVCVGAVIGVPKSNPAYAATTSINFIKSGYNYNDTVATLSGSASSKSGKSYWGMYGGASLTTNETYHINSTASVAIAMSARTYGSMSAEQKTMTFNILNSAGTSILATGALSPSNNSVNPYSGTISAFGSNDNLEVKFQLVSNASTTDTVFVGLTSATVEYTNGGDIPVASTFPVGYDANGGTGTMTDSNSPYNNGASVTVLDNGFTRDGYIFDHWNTKADNSGTNYAEGATFSIGANTTLYAQWVLQADSDGTKDILNYAFTGISGSGYTAWSGKTGTSGATYAGQSNAGVAYIQLRDQSPSGIITTLSGGAAKSITITWGGNNSNGRTVTVYGKHTAYEELSDLYDNEKRGTSLDILTFSSGFSKAAINLSGDYEYIGIKTNGAAYISSIDIVWKAIPASVSGNDSVDAGAQWSGSVLKNSDSSVVAGVTYAFAASNGAVISTSNTASGTFIATAGTITVSATRDGYLITSKEVTVNPVVVPSIFLSTSSINGYTGEDYSVTATYSNLTSAFSWGDPTGDGSISGSVASTTGTSTNGTSTYSGKLTGAGSVVLPTSGGGVAEGPSIEFTITLSTVTITGLPASDRVGTGDNLNLGSLITINATGSCSNDVTWSTSEESIATVDENGIVTGVTPGTVNITVTSDDYPSATMTCVVIVLKPANSTITRVFAADLTNGMSVTSGYAITSESVQNKTGYYQDNGTANTSLNYFRVLSTSPLFSMEPTEIKLTARLGAGSAKNPLGHNIEAVFVDSEGNEISTTKVIVATALPKDPENFVVSMSYDANAYGVKLMHLKEDGWNVRYYSFELSYKYTTSYATLLGTETGEGVESVAMKFSAKISVANWAALGTVTDYGIMMFKRKASDSAYSDTDTPVKDAYRDGVTLSASRKGSGEISPDGDYYIFSAQVNVNNSANYGVVVCAAPFIVVNGTYYFLDEMEYSVNTLATYHLTNGGSSLSTEALTALSGN